MMAAEPASTDVDRHTLARLADVLVPAHGGMPSAGQVGTAADLLDAVLATSPSLGPPLRTLVAAARDRDPAEVVEELERHDPAGLDLLLLVVAGGYYLSPAVRELLGYQGQEPLAPGAWDLPGEQLAALAAQSRPPAGGHRGRTTCTRESPFNASRYGRSQTPQEERHEPE